MKELSVTPSPTQRSLGLIYLAIELFALQPILLLVDQALGIGLSRPQLNFLFFSVNFLCTTLIFHSFLIDSGKMALKHPFRTLLTALTGLVLYFVCNFGISTVIRLAFPWFNNINDGSISEMVRENYVLMYIGVVLLTPVGEELLFRGLIFGSLYNRSKLTAYAVSGVFFAAVHVVGYIGQYSLLHLFLCFLQYIPPALVIGWVYCKADTIWSPILLHVTINQIAILSTR